MKPTTLILTDDTAEARGESDRRVWGLGLCLVLALLFCYAEVLRGMVRQWWDISFYSYAFLIPPVSAYLVWMRRDRLWALRPEPSYIAGAVVVAVGLSALVVGRAGGIQAVQQVSLLITLPGIVLWLFGGEVLKVLALPIGFLWFMLPIWEAVTDPLHLPFQLLSADLGVRLLQLFGVPVYQEGVFIYLPNITLEVARSCSGVNYLIAVLATSIPLATIVLDDVKKRIGLVLLAVTVSALANSLRVAFIGWLAYHDLSGDLHGPYHTLHGIFVSLIGYVVIFAGLWVLSRGQKPLSLAKSHVVWSFGWHQVRTAGIILTVVLGTVGLSRYADRSYPVPLENNLNLLSMEKAGWTGREVPSVETMPGADQALSRSYRNESGDDVRLSVWYFEHQSQGKELVNPATAKLHAGAIRVKLAAGGRRAIEVNRRFLQEGSRKQVVVFWYDVNGRVLVSPQLVKLYTALDSVVHGRTNGALVCVAVDLASDDQTGQERAMAQLSNFVAQAYPLLDDYLPGLAE